MTTSLLRETSERRLTLLLTPGAVKIAIWLVDVSDVLNLLRHLGRSESAMSGALWTVLVVLGYPGVCPNVNGIVGYIVG
jgi:hypothetical protein